MTFLYVSTFADENLFSYSTCHWCISAGALLATWRYMHRRTVGPTD